MSKAMGNSWLEARSPDQPWSYTATRTTKALQPKTSQCNRSIAQAHNNFPAWQKADSVHQQAETHMRDHKKFRMMKKGWRPTSTGIYHHGIQATGHFWRQKEKKAMEISLKCLTGRFCARHPCRPPAHSHLRSPASAAHMRPSVICSHDSTSLLNR